MRKQFERKMKESLPKEKRQALEKLEVKANKLITSSEKETYKIDRNKFFDTEELADMMSTCEKEAMYDLKHGRQTWPIRYMLVHLAFYSGLRVSEIAALRIKDLHLNAKQPFIRVTKGKRGKSRDVYIDKQLVSHLKLFIRYKLHLWAQRNDADAPLFTGRNGQHCTPTSLTISFSKAVEKAGITRQGVRKHLSIHSARHTYATFIYAKSQNMRFAQKQLGHASLNMTSLYADVLPEENSSLANKILD